MLQPLHVCINKLFQANLKDTQKCQSDVLSGWQRVNIHTNL